ncbi:hypothetical protein GGI12_003787 [Dipsacomyces acuminosporus]|nr:hypothetical protein GGI12_003787 [Dipsacomyces acuminosporus]
MSIPTVFTNSVNCPTGYDINILSWCNTYQPGAPYTDKCQINTMADYRRYQYGCLFRWSSKFVDNNNNTVEVSDDLRGYARQVMQPIEFPIGSANQYEYIGYRKPYPLIGTKENCLNARDTISGCCPARPAWSGIFTKPPATGGCVLIDAKAIDAFKYCCVAYLRGQYVPIAGAPVDEPSTSSQVTTTDQQSEHDSATSSDYLSQVDTSTAADISWSDEPTSTAADISWSYEPTSIAADISWSYEPTSSVLMSYI